MLRSMFAAISGLKSHQTMLDVTANDIANVNTIGFKAGRTTFKDSLAQLQSGSAAPERRAGRRQRQAGRPRRAARLDRQPHGRRRAAVDGQRARRRHPGRGLVPRRLPALRRPCRPSSSTPARATSRPTSRATSSRRTAPTSWAAPRPAPAAPTRTCRSRPARRTRRSARTARSPTTRPAAARASSRATSASRSSPTRPASSAPRSNRWNAGASSGTEQVDTAGSNGYGLTTSGAVEMSNVDLASEFTNMITAQRGFQANSRVISTADEILQDLVNLKR